jgi:toxin YoeB
MAKRVTFQAIAWDEYLHWQTGDKKTIKRINLLLKDIERNGNRGLGKPELLKHKLQGWWSREIDETNRLVYRIVNEQIEIAQCKRHYDD